MSGMNCFIKNHSITELLQKCLCDVLGRFW